MSFDEWMLSLGALLLGMVLVGTLLSRLPLTGAMVYLVLGWLLGPDAMNVLRPHPLRHASELQRLAEVALLISLFAVGLRLGVPLRDRRWRLPLRLAVLSLAAMVALVAMLGVLLLDLSPGAAVLLGAVLAPTDPVRHPRHRLGVLPAVGPAPRRWGSGCRYPGVIDAVDRGSIHPGPRRDGASADASLRRTVSFARRTGFSGRSHGAR